VWTKTLPQPTMIARRGVGLPLTARRHDSIFVVVNTMTKSAHFIPVCTTYQAPDITRVFISEIVRLHGVPKRIISD
jgi:hypothetical protein